MNLLLQLKEKLTNMNIQMSEETFNILKAHRKTQKTLF